MDEEVTCAVCGVGDENGVTLDRYPNSKLELCANHAARLMLLLWDNGYLAHDDLYYLLHMVKADHETKTAKEEAQR